MLPGDLQFKWASFDKQYGLALGQRSSIYAFRSVDVDLFNTP